MSLSLFFRAMWRESRGARGRLFFFGACLAVGVAAVVGVAALVSAMEAGIRARSRELLGGDLMLDSRRPLPDLGPLLPEAYRDVARVKLHILSTMVRSERGDSRLAELKAIDEGSGSYPLAGTLELEPKRPLGELLNDTSVLVATELRDTLSLRIGDALYVGGKALRVAGFVVSEPVPLGFAFSFGPRVLMTSAALQGTDLLTFGSRIRYRTVLGFPDGTSQAELTRVEAHLERTVPGAGTFVRIEGHDQAQPALRSTLDKVQRYLGLLALLSLLVASVGVAQNVSAWLRQVAPQTAILRCLGFRPRDVFALYLGNVLLLTLVGSVVGAAVGGALPALVAQLFPEVVPRAALEGVLVGPMLRGVALGVGTALLFSLPPLTSVWRVSPASVLRSSEDPLPVPRALRVLAIALAGLGLFSAALVQSERGLLALAFTAVVVALAGLLWLGARALSWGVGHLPRARLSPLFWHGAAALSRPGAGTTGSIVALGMGTLVVLSIALLQDLLGHEIVNALPSNAPSVFMMDIQPDQWSGVNRIAHSVGASRIDSVPVVTARLSAIDERSVADLMKERVAATEELGRDQWVLNREQRISFTKTLPPDNRVVSGELWSVPDVLEMSLEEGFAKELGATLGSTLRFDVQGVPMDFRVTSLRTVEWRSFSFNFFLLAEPGALEDAPHILLGAARVPPHLEQSLQDRLAKHYPNVTVLRVNDMLERASGMLAQAATTVRLLGSFAVITGLMILVGAVAATQLRRAREAALLKALGLTRARIALMFAVEYALNGAVSGVLGALGANVLVVLVARESLGLTTWPSWELSALAVLLASGLSVIGGLLASARALAVRPLAVLRGRN